MCLFRLLLQFLDFFLRGNLSLEKHPRRKPHDWLPVQGWQDLMRLTELAATKQAPGGRRPSEKVYSRRVSALRCALQQQLDTVLFQFINCTARWHGCTAALNAGVL
jgi:hypothetical protein